MRDLAGFRARPAAPVAAGKEAPAAKRARPFPARAETQPEAKEFNPDQPRDEQGRWTAVGGGESGSAPDGTSIVAAGAIDGLVDLHEEEAVGGHTIRDHVGKSDEYLLHRLEAESGWIVSRRRAGSFPNADAAQKVINSTISENRDMVEAVASGKEVGAFLTKRFNSRTGKEAYRDSANARPYMRDTFGVGVYIVHDKLSDKGFRVLPPILEMIEDAMERPVEFDLIAGQMHADFPEVNAGLTMRQMAAVLCRGVRTAEQRRVAAAHIATLLSSGLSDDELADIWEATPADCFVKKGHIRAMLAAIEDELSETSAE